MNAILEAFDDLTCSTPNCQTCMLIQRPDETLAEWLQRLRMIAACDPDARRTPSVRVAGVV